MLIVREHGSNRKYVTRNYTPKNYNHRIHDNEIFLSINTPAIQTSPHAVFFGHITFDIQLKIALNKQITRFQHFFISPGLSTVLTLVSCHQQNKMY